MTFVPVGELSRTVTLFRLFRREPVDPDTFYTFLARDTVARLERHLVLAGTTVLDVGGGPGYVADAVRGAGARCLVAEYSMAELHLHGRRPDQAIQADGQALPLRTGSVDVCHSSNVLEHVPDPAAMLDEMIRVVRPGGLVYLSFTNWLSPWGGHETSPWHYLGGERAAARYARRHGRRPKNDFGSGLFRVDVADVLRWVDTSSDVTVLQRGSRYLPSWSAPLVMLPGVREVAVWNLELILQRR